MIIKLKKNHSIRGVVEKAGTSHEVHEGVANDLVKRGLAEATQVSFVENKKADK